MSKKSFWKFLAAAVIIGAAVAGCIIYFSKYRDFRKSLDEDFNDFEDDADDSDSETDTEEKEENAAPVKREYVSIPLDTPAETEV